MKNENLEKVLEGGMSRKNKKNNRKNQLRKK